MTAFPLVIVEFASHGDLLGFLLKSRGLPDTYYHTTGKLKRVTAKKMMMFAWQIANGMNFLSENKVITARCGNWPEVEFVEGSCLSLRVFLLILRFFCLLKKTYFQIPIRPG